MIFWRNYDINFLVYELWSGIVFFFVDIKIWFWLRFYNSYLAESAWFGFKEISEIVFIKFSSLCIQNIVSLLIRWLLCFKFIQEIFCINAEFVSNKNLILVPRLVYVSNLQWKNQSLCGKPLCSSHLSSNTLYHQTFFYFYPITLFVQNLHINCFDEFAMFLCIPFQAG